MSKTWGKITLTKDQRDLLLLTLINADTLNDEDEYQTQDKYEIAFDATRLSSGIYLYKLNIGNSFVNIKKMILIK